MKRHSIRTAGSPRCTVAIVVLSAIGVVVPSAVLEQHGPGMHAHDSSPAYDTKSEVTLKGTVAEVKDGRSVMSWLFGVHTLGLGQKSVRDKQVVLKTDTGTFQIHLGPTPFLTENKVEIRKGDVLDVTGSRVLVGDAELVLAREIRKADNVWTLRDATGQPLWNSGQTEPRGFWTKKKVLLAIVAAKAVALATVLRH